MAFFMFLSGILNMVIVVQINKLWELSIIYYHQGGPGIWRGHLILAEKGGTQNLNKTIYMVLGFWHL